MSKVLHRLWAILLGLAAISWFSELVRMFNDTKYVPDRFTIGVALIMTAGLVAWWAIEEWVEADEK